MTILLRPSGWSPAQGSSDSSCCPFFFLQASEAEPLTAVSASWLGLCLDAPWLLLVLELAIVAEGFSVNLLKDELTDGHRREQGDVQGAEVDQF